MNFITNFFGWLIIAYFASIPFIWLWVFYHIIKCQKIEECSNRKCTYWQLCEHNYRERKKNELELIKQMLLHSIELTEEEWDKENDRTQERNKQRFHEKSMPIIQKTL